MPDAPADGGGLIVLTFALPDESRGLVASLTGKAIHRERGRLPVITGDYQGQRVLVAHTGVGELPFYRSRLEMLLARERPRLLISSGYAGGLQPDVAAGDLVLASNVSDAAAVRTTRDTLGPSTRLFEGSLVTHPSAVETAEHKRALGLSTGGVAVDMETSWIARTCAAGDVPLLSLRATSDAVDQAFPVPGHILFDAGKQRPRYVALPWWLLWHPRHIVPFARFVRGVGLAQRHLTAALQRLIAAF